MLLSPLGGTGRAVAAAPAQPQVERPSALSAAPDFTFTKTVEVSGGKARPEAGDTLRYTLTLTNPGPEAQEVVIRDVLEPYLSLAPGSLETTPLAYDQALTTPEDTSLPLTLTGWDGDGDALTFIITQEPAHGLLSGEAPALVYTPDLDYNGPDSFRFKVSDGSRDSLPAQVSIEVMLDNDSPLCSALSLTTAEDSPASLDPDCTDAELDPLTYEIETQPDHGSAAVEDGRLVYTPASNFFGEDAFTYRARDAHSAGLPAAVSVSVTPVNDAPTAAAQSLSLLEDGELEITLSGEDVDGDPLTFAITAAPGSGSLSGAAPDLAYTPLPDFNGPDGFTFEVCEQHPSPLCASAAVSLTVTAVNDAPSFTIGADQTVSEDAGEVAVPAWAADLSPGPADEAGQALSFRITANSNPDLFSGGPAISPEGALSFTPAPDASGSASLTGRLEDDGGEAHGGLRARAPQSFIIQVNGVNDAPQVQAAAFSLDENSANGTLVGTVEFTDPDEGQAHSFAITGGDPHGAFSIHAESGEIRVADSARLDFESAPSFSLTVQVTDDGLPALSGSNTVTVDLNDLDEVPTVREVQFDLDENSPAGALVGVLAFGDLDAGQEHTIAIQSGNTGEAFVLDPPTGELRVANPAALDFETHPVFTLVVSVAEVSQPAHSSSNQVTIHLKDVNEQPQVEAAAFSLDENSANGTLVGKVQASDPDAGDAPAFAITGGDPDGAFAIDAESGEIHVGDSARLDYESAPAFSLTVQVTDRGGLSASGTITIQLNDLNEQPQVEPESFHLNENSLTGTLVGTAQASDPDAGQAHTFAITGGNTDGAFTIHPTTGVIRVDNAAPLDFERNPSFSLTVQATDDGAPALSGSNTITIGLDDVNEAPVLQPVVLKIDENSPNGTALQPGPLAFTDPDGGQTHTFTILSGSFGVFTIDAASGEIRVADSQDLDYEVNDSYLLEVRVTDDGSPALSGTAAITIEVNNVEEAPLVTGESYETLGNTLLEVSDGPAGPAPRVFTSGNLLDNDSDPDGAGALRASLVGEVSARGGEVSLDPGGTFTYLPPAGIQGTDTFTYTVTDQGGSQAQGVVNLNIQSMVWYVKNDAPPGGSGRSNSPFNTLAAAQSASAANSTIYVYRGDGTHSGQDAGISLKQGQRLIGAGVALDVPVQLNSGPPVTTLLPAGEAPLLSNQSGIGVRADSGADIEIRGLNLSDTLEAVNIQVANANTSSVVIRDNTISGAGTTGITVRASGSGTLNLDVRKNTLNVSGAGFGLQNLAQGLLVLQFSENTVTAGGDAVSIRRTGTGVLRITAFENNRVGKDTLGSGIVIEGATFDTGPDPQYQTVNAGSLSIGEPGDGVGGGGLLLTNVRGDLSFTDLDLSASGGAALKASSSGEFSSAGNGFRLVVAQDQGTLTAAGGPALDISTAALDLRLASLISTASTAAGVSLYGAAGTVSAAAGSIENAAGTAFNVTGGSAAITFGGPITNTAGKAVKVASGYSGTLVFSGKIDDRGEGISLTGSSGKYTFSGGLVLETGANTAFYASGGGELVITGAQNTLNTTDAAALWVENVKIGSGGLTFKSINAANSAHGIRLAGTGSEGGLKVTGDTGVVSGGSLRRMTSSCIALSGAAKIELNNMLLANCEGMGLDAAQVNGLILRHVAVSDAGNANGEHGLRLFELTGAALLEDVQIYRAFENGILLDNSAGKLELTLRRVTIEGNDLFYGEDGFQFLLRSDAQAAVLVERSIFRQLEREGIDGVVTGEGVLDLTVNNQNQFSSEKGSGGVTLASGGSAVLRLDLSGNTFEKGLDTPVNLASFDSSTFDGRVANNTIQLSASTETGFGLRLVEEDSSQLTLALEGNWISSTPEYGLLAGASGTGSLHLTLRNNQIQAPRAVVPGAWFKAAGNTSGGENTFCLDSGYAGQAGNNQIAGNANYGSDLDLNQEPGSLFQLEGWNKDSTPSAAVHLKAGNQIGTVIHSGTFSDVTAGSCLQPVEAALPPEQASQPGPALGSAGLTTPEARQAQSASTRAAAPAGPETLSLEIGLLPAGKPVTVTFEVRIQASLPANVWQISNQASVTAGGFSEALLSDDPAAPGSQDATVLDLYRPPLARADAYTTAEDTPLEIAAPGLLGNDQAALGYQALLRALKEGGPSSGSLALDPDGSFRFTPARDFNGLVQFTYRASDARSQSAPGTVSIMVTAVNDAPVLDPALHFRLDPVSASAAENPGTLVSALIAGAGGEAIRDPDPGALQGIAVTGVDGSRGSWQYSLDGGASWKALGAPSPGAARLLVADAQTRLRLVPAPDWVGTLEQAVRFRAWDRSTGTNGGTLDAGSPEAQAAVSAQEASASITLTGNSDLSLSVQAPPGPLLAGTEADFTLTLTNAGPFDASQVSISGQLPPGLTFVSASPQCALSGDRFTCSLSGLEVGGSQNLSLRVLVDTRAHGSLALEAEVAAGENDPLPQDNRTEVEVEVVPALQTYVLDEQPGAEWSRPLTTTSPNGTQLLGEFGSETVTLRLDDLPAHTRVQVTFDLFILRSWDGSQSNWPEGAVAGAYTVAPEAVVGPDRWKLAADGVMLLDTTFSNFANWLDLGFYQAYPENYPEGHYPPQTGAVETDALGYGKLDATYHLSYDLEHTGSSLALEFTGSGLQGLKDESWGLGNLRVSVSAGADPRPYRLYFPGINW